MKEVEIKAVLPADQKSRVLQILNQNYTKLPEKTKYDTLYTKKGEQRIAFRIREENEKIFITEKTRIFSETGGEINTEREFEVSNKEEFSTFMESFGFEVLYTKKKITQPFWSESQKILVEHVSLEGFGEFIEVEKLCQTEESKILSQAEQEVFSVIKSLYLEGYIDPRPYGVIMGKCTPHFSTKASK